MGMGQSMPHGARKGRCRADEGVVVGPKTMVQKMMSKSLYWNWMSCQTTFFVRLTASSISTVAVVAVVSSVAGVSPGRGR